MSVRVAVVVPAGGAGRRMGGVQKAFMELDGKPLLLHALEPFLLRSDIVCAAVAAPPDVCSAPPAWLTSLDERVQWTVGGAERGDSVRSALAIVPQDVDVILIHDAARPFVSAAVIERCINAAAEGRCVVAAMPVTDTIKQVDDTGRIVATPDRRTLWSAQTPQAFPSHVVRDAYARALKDGVAATDDAALVAHYGTSVSVVEGTTENMKITTTTDLRMAASLLRREDA